MADSRREREIGPALCVDANAKKGADSSRAGAARSLKRSVGCKPLSAKGALWRLTVTLLPVPPGRYTVPRRRYDPATALPPGPAPLSAAA